MLILTNIMNSNYLFMNRKQLKADLEKGKQFKKKFTKGKLKEVSKLKEKRKEKK